MNKVRAGELKAIVFGAVIITPNAGVVGAFIGKVNLARRLKSTKPRIFLCTYQSPTSLLPPPWGALRG